MLKGFRDFITRGNLIELAVAFIIGAAFATVVKTFAEMLMGFIGKIGGQPDFGEVTIAEVNVGQFINAVISFLMVAAVVGLRDLLAGRPSTSTVEMDRGGLS